MKQTGIKSLKIIEPIKKGKEDSFFYEGQIASGIDKDGNKLVLEAVGEVNLVLTLPDGEQSGDKESDFNIELNDEVLRKLDIDGKVDWRNNNWFTIGMINKKGEYESSDTVDYEYSVAMDRFKDVLTGEEELEFYQ